MKCNECGKRLESKKLIKKSERFCDGVCRVKAGAIEVKLTHDEVQDLIRQEPRQS
jgi:hypothetical protein